MQRPGILELGVKDIFDGEKIYGKDKKIKFAVIGAVGKIKGQDILLDAVCKLNENIRENCQFLLIGACGNDLWAQSIQQRAEQLGNVKICGQYNRAQIADMLKIVDAVIVPSREETFSIVAVEGMMFNKGVICSDESAVGIAPYVREGSAGILTEPGNADELAEAITWVVIHRDEWNSIGENGRKVYEDYFSVSALKMRVQELMGNVLYG